MLDKIREELHEARRALDVIDDAAHVLTDNGMILPAPFALAMKVADALRKVVDALDGHYAHPARAEGDTVPAPKVIAPSYDPTESERT